MTEKYTATQWAEIEGGHEMTPAKEEPFAFLKDIHESRMTRQAGTVKSLTYTLNKNSKNAEKTKRHSRNTIEILKPEIVTQIRPSVKINYYNLFYITN